MYTPEPTKTFFERLQERLAASRFLTFSALIHAVLVFLFGGVILYKTATDTPDFSASDGGLVASDQAAQAPPEQPPDLTQQQFTPSAPTLNVPALSAISTTNVTTPQFQVAAAVPTMSSPVNDSMAKALQSAAKTIGSGGGTGGVPGAMSGRMGGTARAQAMQMNGGKKESELAVLKGLRWLVKSQNPDGSWGKTAGPVKAAMTGFSLLSFLGHGETPVSSEFGNTVRKALDWVLENGKKNSGHLCMTPEFSQQGVYAHAIVAYALGEYYSMTKDERVADLLKQAVGYIVEGQGPDGGWMYSYDKTMPGDTSVSGWQIQALKAAHLTGMNMDGVDSALDKAMLNLQRVRDSNGSFGYRDNHGKYSLTGVGVLCTYFWEQKKDDTIRLGLEYMMKHTKGSPVELRETKDVYPIVYQDEHADLYAWYYNTQACLMVGGAAWNTWNRLFQTEIVKAQAPDGSWPPMMNQTSPGNLQSEKSADGPWYRTNLCILMLEVYYRYMPSTKG